MIGFPDCLRNTPKYAIFHFPRTYDALIGVVSHDYFDDLSDVAASSGVTGLERRDRRLQTFVRNHYSSHLREILLTLQNEYTDWSEAEQTPIMIRNQVREKMS